MAGRHTIVKELSLHYKEVLKTKQNKSENVLGRTVESKSPAIFSKQLAIPTSITCLKCVYTLSSLFNRYLHTIKPD